MKHEFSPNALFSKDALKKLIIPLIIEQTLALSVGVVDTVMVSHAGENAVSGVSLSDSLNVLLITFFSAIATGGAIVVAQYIGKKQYKKGLHAAEQLLIIVSVIAITAMIACLLLNKQLLALLFGQVNNDIMSSARNYFYITTLSFPFIAIFNVCAALFRGMGNSKAAMNNALIMNAINLLCNILFIYILNLGALGAGLSAFTSRAISAITMLIMLRNPRLIVHIRHYFKRIDPIVIKQILRVGIPNGLENSLFQIGKIIMNGLIATFSTSAIAANAVAGSFSSIDIIPAHAVGLAMTTVIAQCIGAGEYAQAKMYSRYLLKKAYIYIVALNIPLLIFLKPLLSIYNLSNESLTIAYWLMVLHIIFAVLIWPLSFTLPNTFRAAGDVIYPMCISIFSMFTFRVALSFILAYHFNLGVYSVWLAMMVDWGFRSVCYTYHWLRRNWFKYVLI